MLPRHLVLQSSAIDLLFLPAPVTGGKQRLETVRPIGAVIPENAKWFTGSEPLLIGRI